MYKAFFNLQEDPFDLAPNPAFLVQTKRHNEALAALYCGVLQHKGLTVLIGESGTGKTLLLRCLISFLKQSKDVAYAYLFNNQLSQTEFLHDILLDFGLSASGKSKYEAFLDLNEFLVSRGSRNLTTVLILDDAHLLSAETLEEVLLLANLKTKNHQLLQIILAGQPELDKKLDSAELGSLKQRVFLRMQLCPLRDGETIEYVRQRLQIAGVPSPREMFPERTIKAVHHYSQGLPRLINTICENALMIACAKQSQTVTSDMIRSVAHELLIDGPNLPKIDQTKGNNELNLRRLITCHWRFKLWCGQRR